MQRFLWSGDLGACGDVCGGSCAVAAVRVMLAAARMLAVVLMLEITMHLVRLGMALR